MLDYLMALLEAHPTGSEFLVPQDYVERAGVDIVEGRPLTVWAEPYGELHDATGSLLARFFA